MKAIFNQIKRFTGADLQDGKPFTIKLEPTKSPQIASLEQKTINTTPTQLEVGKSYKIQVKQYMTEHGTPSFDFMTKWNNDVPMPLMTMVGTVEKETRVMVYMNLHGKAEKTTTCIRCGRKLTNPISMYYGIGPECGEHFYINPFSTEDELQEHLEEIKHLVENITWKGWIIKSAIKEFSDDKS